ncbi:MAG: fasciclin domain-containing protein [Lewinellaceae bacterium]|nr:fasciclin domain-containing protein [Lewinellaceae bacterium]
MKNVKTWVICAGFTAFAGLMACNDAPSSTAGAAAETAMGGGQSTVADETSQPNVVQIASGSKDHTTLVAAIKAADYVDVLVNAGPFTVFAPTNAAFDALPEGTVANLLKPENKAALQEVLEYHVFVGVINKEAMREGQRLNQVNLKNVTLSVKDGKYMVNDANIIASIPASNGVVHVIDKVLLPQ